MNIKETTRSSLEYIFLVLGGGGVVINLILASVSQVLNMTSPFKEIEAVILVITFIALITALVLHFYPKSKITDDTDEEEVR